MKLVEYAGDEEEGQAEEEEGQEEVGEQGGPPNEEADNMDLDE